MQTKQVVELLKKHLSGDLTAAEAERLSGWIQASGANATLFENLNDPEFLGAQLYRFDSVNADRGWQKLLSRQKNDLPLRKPAYKWAWTVAAAAAVLLSIALWTLTGEKSFYKKNASIKTKRGEKLSSRLPDGSQVILNSGSTIIIEPGFNETNRAIQLEGEAYFDIAHNPSIPFIIHTGSMKLSVLGTAFNVRAYADEKAEVTSLISGKVEVTIPETKEGNTARKYILERHQKLTVQKPVTIKEQPVHYKNNIAAAGKGIQIDSLRKSQLGDITEIAWIANKLVFDNEPMASVADKIEKWYGIKVSIEATELNAIHCSGSFETEPLDKVLESMQFSIPTLKFKKVENNTVLILYK